jgi:hypothetical protein
MIRSKRFACAAALIVILAVLAHVPVLAQDNLEICTKALLKCGVDATIAGLLSGGTALLLMVMGCLIGYDFCLKYYVPLKR